MTDPTTLTSEPEPVTPGHRPDCKCPPCNTRRKALRGEPIKQPTPEQRHERAVANATKRWEQTEASRYDWDRSPLPEAERHLADIRQELERGARALQLRYDSRNKPSVPCEVCHKDIPNGRWHHSKVIKHPVTQLPTNIFFCSPICIAKYHQAPEQQPQPDHRLSPSVPQARTLQTAPQGILLPPEDAEGQGK